MSSQRRIDASRANGAKSRGPVTTAGKRISSRNRIRHGILSRTVVLEGEDSRVFQHLLSELHAEFDPHGPVETALMEKMAVAHWREMRIWGLEKASLDHEIRQHASESADPPTQAAIAFRALSDESRASELLNRYEARYDRQFARSLARLLDLQARRKTQNTFLPFEPSPKIEHPCGAGTQPAAGS